MSEPIAESDFRFWLRELRQEIRVGFGLPSQQRSFSLLSIIDGHTSRLIGQPCSVIVYTGDWIANKQSTSDNREFIEGEIGVLTMTRPIDDAPHPECSPQDDPLFMIVVHLDNDSCAAALSMCRDILSSGYHISAKVRVAGPELNRVRGNQRSA